MNVSFLSHIEFASKVTQLNWHIRELPFGTEVSLWNADKLYALGFGKVEDVKTNLSSQFSTIQTHETNETHTNPPQELVLVGTAFQHRVWKQLLDIPKGQKVTYQYIADKILNPKAVRAVGSAIGRNPISLYVPCHRVVRQDGHMGGYRWGLNVKEKILAWEVD